MSAVQIKKLNSFHERLADWLIANPGVRQSEAAKFFGYTEAWISTVIHSDAFQEYYQQLSSSVSSHVVVTTRDRVVGLANLAMDELGERLAGSKAKDIPLPQLLEVADTMLKRGGYGDSPAQAPQASLHLHVVTQEDIAAARSAMREVRPAQARLEATSPGGDVVEGVCVEVPQKLPSTRGA